MIVLPASTSGGDDFHSIMDPYTTQQQLWSKFTGLQFERARGAIQQTWRDSEN